MTEASGAEKPRRFATTRPAAAHRRRRWIPVTISIVAVVAVFTFVLPQLGSYDQAWSSISAMTVPALLAVVLTAVLALVAAAFPHLAALPGLTFGTAFVQAQTAGAISSTVPAGGAFAVGATFRICTAAGLRAAAISTAVATTGVVDQAVKLALPIVAVIGVTLTGEALVVGAGLIIAAAILLIAMAVALWLLLRRRSTARSFGRWLQLLWNWARRRFTRLPDLDITPALEQFRDQTVGLLRQRGGRVVTAVLTNQLVGFFLFFVILLAVAGKPADVSVVAVFCSFTVARLAGLIPITPGGLGTVDLALTTLLTAFGVNGDSALAANLVWRAASTLPTILVGACSYLLWRRRHRSPASR